MIRDIMIQQYIHLYLFSMIFLKSQINFFIERIYYINCLKYTKKLKMGHTKEKLII